MKKEQTYRVFLKYVLPLFLCNIFIANAQIKKTFSPRFSETVKGNATIIANNMLSRHATNNYTGSAGNHDFDDNVFVDIDNDNSTFNSSNANFINPLPIENCLIIRKAYLYWAAADHEEDDQSDEPNWNYDQVKVMYPNSGAYSTITADNVIYRGRDDNGDGNANDHFVNDPYICFKDITSTVQNLNSPYGVYQLANVRAKEGSLVSHGGGNTGTSGGWQIVFIYENPTLPSKNITIFDGYAHVTEDEQGFDIEFNGFQTIPSGDVDANIILGSLEGDRDLSGDKLQIRNAADTNWVDLSTNMRGSNNFFNSRITTNGNDFIDRVPESTNTLGFDAAVFPLDNSGNNVIANNQTSTKVRLTSDQETYGLFLLGLCVDVWEPNLNPLNLQTSISSGASVNADDQIDFSVDITNTGNDDVENLILETTIPEELTFISATYPTPGISHVYYPATRILEFTVDDGMADVGDDPFNIQFKLQVNNQCYFLETKCADSFQIQLTATYNGVQNPNQVTTLSSSELNDCGIGNMQPFIIPINQPAMVDWLTAVNALDIEVSCDDSQGLLNAQNLIPELENCNLTITKTSGMFVSTGSCAVTGTYTNSWNYADVCGRNGITFSQVITVIDSDAPVFDANSLPADVTVECDDNIPALEDVVLTATDNCADVSDIIITPSEVITNQDDECANNYTITRTWVANDCAGNSIQHVQVITVIDSNAPVFDANSLPADVTVECDDSIPALEDVVLTATDNCADVSDIIITPSEVITNQDDECANNYTITRTWVANDCAGNSIQHVQVITVIDSDAPVFDANSLPADVTVECDDNIPALEDVVLTATDNCADVNDIVITPSEVITNQDDECANNYTITRTWVANDCAGNSIQHVQVITVIDSDAPVFDANSLPVDVTVECDDNIPALEDVVLTATDNCADVSDIIITPSEVITNQDDECANNYTVTRTWVANDCAGNSIQHVQVITVIDSDAPVFDANSLPADVTVECDDNIPALEDVVLTATDNCADVSDIVITPSEVITNQDDECANNYTITRTWVANDCAGNSIQHVQVITVIDSDAPVFDANSLPVDVTVECDDNIPALEDVVLTATDNCADVSDIIITPSEVITNQDDECANNYTITRTWVANDCAGNSIQHVQVITVIDSNAPVFDANSLPADVTVECDDSIPALEDVVLTATDNCADVSDIIITPSEVITNQDDECANNYTITRTWVANDCAGNSIQHVQVITVIDSDAPVFDANSLPADVTVECDDNIPALEDVVLTATDNCADVNDIVITPSEVITNQDDECANNYTITRTWVANDCAGNSIQHVQVITVIDSDAPVFDANSLPVDVTVECDDNIPALEDVVLTATDNCADVSDIIITPSEVITNQDDECANNYTVTRTWVANDCAGNSIQHVQVITVIDSDAPVFDANSLPADVTVECDDNIPALEDVVLTATDNCADVSDIVITPSEVITNQDDECANNYTITRTWVANDCAGNSIQHVQVITVIDSDAPVFDANSLPVDVTVECDDNIPALEDVVLTATDNCADVSDIIITPSEVITNQDDECANNYTVTRTWVANDCAGNSIQHVQVITVIDSDAPVFDANSLPADVTVECDDNIPALEDVVLTATDNCADVSDIVITPSEVITNQDDECANNYTITRTWVANDCAGNSIQHVQVITVIDSDAPVFDANSLPVDVTVECDDNIPALEDVVLTATDNCADVSDIIITPSEVITNQDDECANNYTVTRTWVANDCAGNSIQHVQVITVIDSDAPVFDANSLPADVTVECDDNIPALEDVVLTATDNCADVSDIVITPSEVITNQDDECANNYTITRTWVANDCAGNSIQHVQVITVIDSDAPTFVETLPGDITVECDSIPDAAILTAIDNCDSNLTVDYSENQVADPNGCATEYVITRMWTVTDCAGNTNSHTQTINVEDSSEPVLSGDLPQDVTVECDNIPDSVSLTVEDNCGNDIPIQYTEVITGQDDECAIEYTITRTWNVTDCAGNNTSHVQVITVQDTTDPVFDANSLPADVTVECDDNIPALEDVVLTATDNCADVSDIVITPSEVITNQDDECANNYTITRTWVANDCAGNSIQHVQVITVIDSDAPVFDANSLPADVTVECDDNIPALEDVVLTATDNCADVSDIVITPSEVITNQDDECANNYTITRTWVANDCAGNSIQHVQVITVIDSDAPVFDANSLPADVTVECDDNIPALEDVVLTATDNCADVSDIVITPSEVITNQDDECANNYTITRIWVANDCAGNSIQHVQVITVIDSDAPVFDANSLPADVTVECDDNIPALEDVVLTATDNCADVSDIIITPSEVITNQDDECANNYTVTRTWVANDCAGNSIQHVQVITVIDSDAPVFDANSLPADVTVECDDNIPALEDVVLTATDNCADVSDIVITPSEVITNQDDECANNYTITRTWVANDCAGNSIQHVQVITVIDSDAPTFVETLPGDITVECDSIPDAAILTAIDNCDSNLTVDYSENQVADPNGCATEYVITRMWTVTDCAGNTNSHTQTINVEDSSEPVLSGDLPQDVTVECDNIPDSVSLTVEDNCGNDIPIQYTEVITGQDDECAIEYTITRTWNVTDCAGNNTSHVQVITVQDTTDPVFDANSLPADVTVECDDNIPALEDVVLTATDNCADVSDIVITPSEVITNQDDECANNYTITRTWVANDCAGNSIQHVQVITVIDSDAPVFDANSLPADVTVECDDNIPALEDVVLTATDNCADVSDIVITPSEVITNQDDECANNYTITRTWVANDCAGNSIQHVQVITVIDSDAPVFDANSLPADVTVECDDNIPALEDVVLTATDNCADVSDIVITPSEVITNQDDECANNYTITRIWVANDCAGNSIQHVQVITVIDSDAPVFDANSLPADVTVECDDDIPALEDVVITATDNCADVSDIVITPSEVITNQDDECANNYTITRTWVANDCAGNSIQHVQVITVIDSDAPVFDANSLPADVTVECDDSIPALEDVVLTATDNCADVSDIVITPSEVITNQDDECTNNYTITRTWVANDCAGNSIQHVQVITVQDTTLPTLSAGGSDGYAECTGSDPAMNDDYIVWRDDYAGFTATDNCGSATLSVTEGQWTSDGCSSSITISIIATDDCGLQSPAEERTFTITDTTAPEVLSDIEEIVFYCNEVPPVPELDIEEECSDEATIVFTETTEGTEGFEDYQIIRNWVITDDCGNETLLQQLLLVEPDCDCLEDKFISKAVTPNGDIFNDYLKVEGIDDCGTPSIKIFNRWGNLVYQSNVYDSKKGRWRGTSEGGITIGGNNNLPTGTYYYIIELKNKDVKPITGHVYLSTK